MKVEAGTRLSELGFDPDDILLQALMAEQWWATFRAEVGPLPNLESLASVLDRHGLDKILASPSVQYLLRTTEREDHRTFRVLLSKLRHRARPNAATSKRRTVCGQLLSLHRLAYKTLSLVSSRRKTILKALRRQGLKPGDSLTRIVDNRLRAELLADPSVKPPVIEAIDMKDAVLIDGKWVSGPYLSPLRLEDAVLRSRPLDAKLRGDVATIKGLAARWSCEVHLGRSFDVDEALANVDVCRKLLAKERKSRTKVRA